MNNYQIAPLGLEAVDGCLPAVGRAIINNPEDPFRPSVRWLAHHISDQPIKGLDSGFALTSSKQPGVVDIPASDIVCHAGPLIFVFYLHRLSLDRSPGFMDATASLNAGFFICTDDKFVRIQSDPFPYSVIQVQYTDSLWQEVRVSGKDPTTVLPRFNGIAAEPAPYGGTADLGDNASLHHLFCNIAMSES